MNKDKDTDNSQVYKKNRRMELEKKHGKCSRCPPHRGENFGAKRYGKHGPKKPKYKD